MRSLSRSLNERAVRPARDALPNGRPKWNGRLNVARGGDRRTSACSRRPSAAADTGVRRIEGLRRIPARNRRADRIDEERSMTIAIQTALERLIEVQSSHRPLAPLSETHGDFTLEHAYAVQDALRAELDQRGQRSIGWKLGATSPNAEHRSGSRCKM